MHLPNELLSPEVCVSMFVISGSVAGISIAKIKKDKKSDSKIPLMGVLGAFIFAAQMVNFPVLAGTSGHLVGGVLLAILLGPFLSFFTMIGIFTIQCLVFQDGGLLALGANIFNMGVIPCFIGYYIFKTIISKTKKITKTKLFLASFLSGSISVELGALMVPVEIGISNINNIPFSDFLIAMGSVHILIGIIEGIITGIVVNTIAISRPDFLNDINLDWDSKLNKKQIVIGIILFTFITAGFLSLLASELPDGLEWSLSKYKLKENKLAKKSNDIQSSIAIFPDYTNPKSSYKYWTAIAGIVGALLTGIFIFMLGFFLKQSKKR